MPSITTYLTEKAILSKKNWRFRHIFVAFSEYMNFNKDVTLEFTTIWCVLFQIVTKLFYISIFLALKKQILSKPNLLYHPYCGRIVTNFDAATERLRNLKVKIDALA